ncbi:MAG: M20/M25/M40 family metallo-hydrolase, partial [Gammaproteobacteria bacterium]
LKYDLDWRLSGHPFLTPKGALVHAARAAIKEVAGIETDLSTSGGTSDGRFIAPTGAQVLELGVVNASIHKLNECVHVGELDTLSAIYERMIKNLLL